jgi:hypothetical protein
LKLVAENLLRQEQFLDIFVDCFEKNRFPDKIEKAEVKSALVRGHDPSLQVFILKLFHLLSLVRRTALEDKDIYLDLISDMTTVREDFVIMSYCLSEYKNAKQLRELIAEIVKEDAVLGMARSIRRVK